MIIKDAFTKLQADLPAAEQIARVCVYGGASEGPRRAILPLAQLELGATPP